MNVVHFLVDGFTSGGIKTATARHVENAAARAIDFVDEINQPDGIVFRSLENYRARAIAKNHTRGTIRIINDR